MVFLTDGTTRLTTVSEYTKRDILDSTGCKKEITVIPNSIVFDISWQRLENPDSGGKLAEKYWKLCKH